MTSLTDRSTHFEFGRNWADYASQIDGERIETAKESLRRLVPDLAGKTFLDIGSGSGLFSLAALQIGATHVTALDIDENSVATTQAMLSAHAEKESWAARQVSVFETSPEETGRFDVVYSWGVLHHTGDMWRAIRCAAALVAPAGTFVIAIYRKTPLCGAWRIEKSVYAKSPASVQALIRGGYYSAFVLGLALTGRSPFRYMREYGHRGMRFRNDVHDWLGGYPYESAATEEIVDFVAPLGFEALQVLPVKVNAGGAFGVGCSEYVFRRTPQP